jgi:hypothetical protein
VVASLAIASFATILQGRLPVHLAEASAASGGQPTQEMLANAAAFAFGDVYRTALVIAAVAWLLVWTLRRNKPVVDGPVASEASPSTRREADQHLEREPVLVGE